MVNSVGNSMFCEVWTSTIDGTPTHSTLYHLSPIGIGTGDVENMTSYIARLAQAHHVYPRTLLRNQLWPRLHRTYWYDDGKIPSMTAFWRKSSALNGTSALTRDVIKIIETLTGLQGLHALTMLRWAEVVSPKGLLRFTQAWCPACYDGWRSAQKIIYTPLLWSLTIITACPYHRMTLQTTCRICQRTQHPLHGNTILGYCIYCRHWLGGEGHKVKGSEKRWRKYIVTCEVVGAMLQEHLIAPLQDNLTRSLDQYLRGALVTEVAREVGVQWRTVREWQKGLYPPQLDSLLSICALLKLSPVDLAIGDNQLKNLVPTPDLVPRTATRPYRVFPAMKIQKALEDELALDRDPPLSMHKVAQRLSYDQSFLARRFPDLCQAISHLRADDHDCLC